MPRCGSLVGDQRQALGRPSCGLAALDLAHAVVGGGPTASTSSSSSVSWGSFVVLTSEQCCDSVCERAAGESWIGIAGGRMGWVIPMACSWFAHISGMNIYDVCMCVCVRVCA